MSFCQQQPAAKLWSFDGLERVFFFVNVKEKAELTSELCCSLLLLMLCSSLGFVHSVSLSWWTNPSSCFCYFTSCLCVCLPHHPENLLIHSVFCALNHWTACTLPLVSTFTPYLFTWSSGSQSFVTSDQYNIYINTALLQDFTTLNTLQLSITSCHHEYKCLVVSTVQNIYSLLPNWLSYLHGGTDCFSLRELSKNLSSNKDADSESSGNRTLLLFSLQMELRSPR